MVSLSSKTYALMNKSDVSLDKSTDLLSNRKGVNMTPVVADAVINISIVSELVQLVKTVMGLFSEFPLNVLLIASLCFVAFGIFSRAKSAAM